LRVIAEGVGANNRLGEELERRGGRHKPAVYFTGGYGSAPGIEVKLIIGRKSRQAGFSSKYSEEMVREQMPGGEWSDG